MPPRTHAHTLTHTHTRAQAAAAVAAAAAEAVSHNSFVVPASVVASLRSCYALSDESLLLALIPPARAAARPPVSAFYVGAAALGASGAAYLGANVEFAGAPLHAAIHAEQFAVTVARAASERGGLTHLATSAAPCGHCRQFLCELPRASSLRCVTAGAEGAAATLAHLLPAAFGPADLLGEDAAPLLLQARHNGVQLAPPGTAALAAARASGDAALTEAIYAALAAANGAHAPYSRCPAGVALLRDGARASSSASATSASASSASSLSFCVHAGGSAESVAFNPSLTPLAAAAVAAASGGAAGDWSDVTRAVLVELPNAPVSYADATRAILASAMPRCVLTVLPAEGNLEPQWVVRPEEVTQA
jgi:cytidine deaminase